MQNRSLIGILAEWCAVVGVFMIVVSYRQPANPAPVSPVAPAPITPAKPDGSSKKPLLPWRDVGAGLQLVNGPEHDGTHVACELVESLMMWNRGGSDGSGMCVMSSIEMAGLAQNVYGVKGLRDWCAKQPGGAYPSKVDRQIKDYYQKVHNMEPPEYRQYEGKDIEAALELVSKTGRMICCTYGTSPRYGNRRISHMVCSPLYAGKFCVILDNNAIGGVEAGKRYEWIDKAEGLRRIRYPSGEGWVFVWLAPPPPPFLQVPPKVSE